MAGRARTGTGPLEPEVVRGGGAADAHLESARLLARLLDDLVPIPGTSFRIGIDPILGLVPGAGDLIAAALSSWILVAASRLGAPAAVLARMGLNVAVDAVVGAIPFAGDLFDAGWKANVRNLRLLEDWMAKPREARRASGLVVAGIVAATLVAVAAVGWGAWQLLTWAVRAAGAG
jgi:hypothetical protein